MTLKKLGINDLVHFDFMDPPAPETMMRALELLNYLGALDDEGEMTKLGGIMSGFPWAHSSKTLIESSKHGCANEILTIVALLSVPQIFMRLKKMLKRQIGRKLSLRILLGSHYIERISDEHNGRDPNWCYDNFCSFAALKIVTACADNFTVTCKKTI